MILFFIINAKEIRDLLPGLSQFKSVWHYNNRIWSYPGSRHVEVYREWEELRKQTNKTTRTNKQIKYIYIYILVIKVLVF